MTKDEVMKTLQELGKESTKKTFLNHGATEPIDGVLVGDLKVLVKKIKVNHDLALQLYDTGHSDAMYLAGLIADPKKMTVEMLEDWVKKANWHMHAEYTVAHLAAESPHGLEMANRWIQSDHELIATAGWNTYSGVVALKPDHELDLQQIKDLLEGIGDKIHQAPNRVRYTMNNFVISVAASVVDLHDDAYQIAERIGKVSVDMGNTACKVPLATQYIDKIMERGKVGAKRKKVRC